MLLLHSFGLFAQTDEEDKTPISIMDQLEKFDHKSESVNEQEKTGNSCFSPDINVAGISLLNSDGVAELFGKDVMEKLGEAPPYNTSILSSDKQQEFVIEFHPGSVDLEFSTFKVQQAVPNEIEKLPVSQHQQFQTESGIALGMSKDELIELMGSPDVEETDILTTLTYEITDLASSAFLQKYNLPKYAATYYFHAGKLVEYHIGFEYP